MDCARRLQADRRIARRCRHTDGAACAVSRVYLRPSTAWRRLADYVHFVDDDRVGEAGVSLPHCTKARRFKRCRSYIMQIKVFRHLWGYPITSDATYRKIRDDGYTGIEVGLI